MKTPTVSVERTVQGWAVVVNGVVHSTYDDPDSAEIRAGWIWDELLEEAKSDKEI